MQPGLERLLDGIHQVQCGDERLQRGIDKVLLVDEGFLSATDKVPLVDERFPDGIDKVPLVNGGLRSDEDCLRGATDKVPLVDGGAIASGIRVTLKSPCWERSCAIASPSTAGALSSGKC